MAKHSFASILFNMADMR